MTERNTVRAGRRSGGRRLVWYAAAVLALLLAVTGCSENPAPEPLEPDTAAASSTPTPTPSPSGAPTLPPEARGTSDKAAIAFVEHWVSLFNHSTQSLDTDALERASHPDCDACLALIDSISRVHGRGGHIKGAGWSLSGLQVLTAGASARPQVRALVTFAPRTVVESKDAEPLQFEGGKSVYTFDLVRHSKIGWQVADIIGVDE